VSSSSCDAREETKSIVITTIIEKMCTTTKIYPSNIGRRRRKNLALVEFGLGLFSGG